MGSASLRSLRDLFADRRNLHAILGADENVLASAGLGLCQGGTATPEIESPMSGLAIAAIKYPANAIGFLFRSLSEWVRQAVGAHFVHNAYLAELRGLRSLGVWIENPGDE